MTHRIFRLKRNWTIFCVIKCYLHEQLNIAMKSMSFFATNIYSLMIFPFLFCKYLNLQKNLKNNIVNICMPFAQIHELKVQHLISFSFFFCPPAFFPELYKRKLLTPFYFTLKHVNLFLLKNKAFLLCNQNTLIIPKKFNINKIILSELQLIFEFLHLSNVFIALLKSVS